MDPIRRSAAPARLLCLFAALVASCTSTGSSSRDSRPADALVLPGLFEDCTPGAGETPCQAGLRCGLVTVGDTPYTGWLTQCVPMGTSPLPEEAACDFTSQASPRGKQTRHYDHCAVGLGCVTLPQGGQRCRSLCPLQSPEVCSQGRLCVLPAQVSAQGFCAAPDGCDPVAQQGCPAGPSGMGLGCYVLGDGYFAGTYCLPQDVLGDSTGDEGSACNRSPNCKPGLGCVTVGTATTCHPYCSLALPDGGLPDAGNQPVTCGGGVKTCHPITGYASAGRCY